MTSDERRRIAAREYAKPQFDIDDPTYGMIDESTFITGMETEAAHYELRLQIALEALERITSAKFVWPTTDTYSCQQIAGEALAKLKDGTE